jgi:hypothetical protein
MLGFGSFSIAEGTLLTFWMFIGGLALLMIALGNRSKAVIPGEAALLALGPVQNPRVAVFHLGDDPDLFTKAGHDVGIYQKVLPDAKLLSVTSLDRFAAELLRETPQIVHVINEFDDSGRVIWQAGVAGEAIEVLKACLESQVYFVFFAAGFREGQAGLEKRLLQDRRSCAARFQLAVLIHRGVEFDQFLEDFVVELREGRSPAVAWLKVRPQDAGGPPPEEDLGPAGLLVA